MTRLLSFSLVLAVMLVAPGCQTLQQVAALRDVKFAIDRVAEAELAGVPLASLRRYEDLSPADILRLTNAFATKNLPLDFDLHLLAENPPDNTVSARLLEMDWTLLLDDKETISGTFTDDVLLVPGQPTDVSIPIRLDLADFFSGGARDLVELALAVAGQGGGEPKRIKLRAIPTIETPIGPIRYPEAITIVSREI